MTVVVTGASGHVGANLVQALIDDGQPVRALVHKDRRGLEGLPVQTIQGDVCDPSSLDRAFDGAEVVYHAAARISLLWGEWEPLHAVNVAGTRSVVDACLRNGVGRLVHFSSTDAIDMSTPRTTVDEECPLVDPADSRRLPAYDRSKAAAEIEVRSGIARGLDAIIISPTAILGPHDYRPSHQGQMLIALARRRLPALVAGGYDWVDVRDVVAGARAACSAGSPGAKYILSGQWASVSDLAFLAQEATGVRAPRLICPMGLARLGAPIATAWARLLGSRPLFTKVSLHALRGSRYIAAARAVRDLGYCPRPLLDTIRDTYRWLVETGYLGLESK